MLTVLKIIGRTGLVLTILPSVLYAFGMLQLPAMKGIMILGSLLWLVAAPILQKLKESQPAGS